ncbi:hypothetical protein SJA_C2-00050 [Sphingobium indicum UT26S]|uniref:Uncharacterized protein n=1 Tax=Sphingobium indicum (strain DSM 16413 / CCM 7287 / MTCC 6362 / UT26 / NBRC 101211 / UT26S) TaxID=452662 RepID=D4Z799_SPHIU|nr:hypothetical protein SJA_C2-00050 [Sphingobium indicum UT26S]
MLPPSFFRQPDSCGIIRTMNLTRLAGHGRISIQLTSRKTPDQHLRWPERDPDRQPDCPARKCGVKRWTCFHDE